MCDVSCDLVLAKEKWFPKTRRFASLPGVVPEKGAQKYRVAVNI